MLRKRKISEEIKPNIINQENSKLSVPGNNANHKVIHLSNVIWLLFGLLIGKYYAIMY